MRRLLFICTAAVILAATGRGDRLAARGRLAAGLSTTEPPRTGSEALPRFTLFGWVSPPHESTTAARYAELVDAGFNVTVLAWEDVGTLEENRKRLELTRTLGVHNLILDNRLDRIEVANPSTYAVVDTIAQDYAGEPSFFGYYLGDEPAKSDFGWLARVFDILRERDPSHPGWNNLLGRMAFPTRESFLAYTRAYADTVKPIVLCNDHYEFLLKGDRGTFMENIVGLATVARERALPFWGIVQLVQHRSYRPVTRELLSWQVGHWLAYGTRGIGYFTYWTPAPDTFWQWQPSMIEWGTGSRTPLYDMVKSLNTSVRPIGEALAELQWLTTEHSGSLPLSATEFAPDSLLLAVEGRAAIGTFVDSLGTPHMVLVNSDSAAARTLRLTLPASRRLERFIAAGQWSQLPGEHVPTGWQVLLPLEAGGFTLLRSPATLDNADAGSGKLRLSTGANPARGSVVFAVQGARGGARIELLDATGRRVWSRRVPVGSSEAVWDGRRGTGGPAERGVYFARLEDSNGARVRRVVWMGPR